MNSFFDLENEVTQKEIIETLLSKDSFESSKSYNP